LTLLGLKGLNGWLNDGARSLPVILLAILIFDKHLAFTDDVILSPSRNGLHKAALDV